MTAVTAVPSVAAAAPPNFTGAEMMSVNSVHLQLLRGAQLTDYNLI